MPLTQGSRETVLFAHAYCGYKNMATGMTVDSE